MTTNRIILTFEYDDGLTLIDRKSVQMVHGELDENGEVKEAGVYSPDELRFVMNEEQIEFEVSAFDQEDENWSWLLDGQLDENLIENIVEGCKSSPDFARKLIEMAKEQGSSLEEDEDEEEYEFD